MSHLKNKHRLMTPLAKGCVWLCLTGAATAAPTSVDFESQIRPLLEKNCFECHSHGVKIKGGLVLDSRSGWQEGGDSGPAIMPGDADKSLLIRAVRYTDKELQMPPKKKLAPEELALLEAWVKTGAADPRGPQADAVVAKKGIDMAEGRKHWSYLPVVKPAIPSMAEDVWSQNDIDRLVLAKLRSEGRQPAAEVDRRTLLRRASFDLLGVPPTFTEVEAFVHDPSPGAFEMVVDRLLNSPLYGQRWGRHWLDVARYADTREESVDAERRFPFAYTYRDYVINAFNNDKPFDQFIIEQIAADKMPDSPRENLAALGFLTVGRRFQGNADAANLVVDDRIDVVTRGFLGLTVSCARCHDHKFDAVPTKDYYSLFGIFASMEEPLDKPELRRDGDMVAVGAHLAGRHKILQEIVDQVDAVHKSANQNMKDFCADYLEYVVASSTNHRVTQGYIPLDTPRGMLLPEGPLRWDTMLARSKKTREPFFAMWHRLMDLPREGFAEAARQVMAEAAPSHRWVDEVFKSKAPASMVEVAQVYGQLITRALAGKSDEAKGIQGLIYGAESPVPISRSEIEEDLKRFLTDRKLTQRSEITTAGELRTKLDAFEAASPIERAMAVKATDPVNPHVLIRGNAHAPGAAVPRRFLEVLDMVDARQYNDDGRLEVAQAIASHKNPLTARVLVNRVWQQHFGTGLVSTADDFGVRAEKPSDPALLDYLATWFMEHGWSIKALHKHILLSATWQQSRTPQRLQFEPMRDALLYVAGNLDPRFGGAGEPMNGESRRRAVYNFTDRFRIPSLLRNFDVANPDTSISRRSETLVPQQALFLMNSPFVHEQAVSLARHASPTPDPVRDLYQQIFAREPDAEEHEWCAEFVKTSTLADLAQALLLTNEFVVVK